MRVLSFIPAFLLAAASFVAAAPSSAPSVPSSVPAVPSTVPSTSPADTSCVPSGGDDSALQPVIAILANATAYIQPLNGQLSGMQSGDSCTSDDVSPIVIQITAIVDLCVTQLQAALPVDCSGLDLTNLCATIYALLCLVLEVLNCLVAIVLVLGSEVVGTLQTVICNLLNAITGLVGCLNVFIDVTVSGVLGPVLALVCSVVDLLLCIVGNLNVVLGN